ncbi:S24/S26 family peptidase [Pseudodesulfovibrio sp.]|uniref:S24 family peptidase n=1 Tax=Pseudodesulfovibrio sp. TaxID=2035812 RepID=UPI002623A89D|nr:S24/S26 family peptidase [Pseudodesulfovibrio sp.]MDD3311929.1 S24/S26 family peptidase [Pseudodesulfovibrio sp.]
MGFTDDVRRALNERIGRGKRYPNNKRMADELGIDPSQLGRFLKRERGLNADSLGQILDRLGASVTFGDDPAEASREVRFCPPGEAGGGPELRPDDYLAVPLADPILAAGQGSVPEDRVKGWVLVWRHQEPLRFRTNLVGVELGKAETAMAPTLHPGDIVLVDRDDRDPAPAGRTMLVREPGPEGATLVRRVATRRVEGDLELIFYSDNSREFPPATYRLQRDYGGDIARAIGGNVAWAWSDMGLK